MREPLASWLAAGSVPDAFPYPAVVAAFHRAGKHFVPDELLGLLDRIRATATDGLLRAFLDVALDKWDGRYDYQSYLALRLLPIPGAGEPPDAAGRQHDRLFPQLIADALEFELAAAAGATDLMPGQRPDAALATKRYRLGVRAATPALARRGLLAIRPPEPAAAAAALCTAVVADQTAAEKRNLALTMLPVYTLHDEYLFIRVLQAYECVFALLATELGAAVDALSGGGTREAAGRVAHARTLLDGTAPLFSLMATMQPESFRTFRVYTEGASAIQSRSYKLVEALCRTPDEPRLSSAAYRSVPDVRDRVLAGLPSLAEAYRKILPGPDRRLLDMRMSEFADALFQWRRTHYGIATRMLGTRSGTGYTEGTPYLAAARSIPVFAPTDGRSAPMSDIVALRDQFPLLKTCVYLNNNSTGAVPAAAEQVLTDYWQTLCGWRDDVWEGWHVGLDAYVDRLAAFIGAAPGSVVTDANLSTLLSRVASCFDYRPPRDRVVITDLEFPTIPFVWKAFGRYGAQVDVVGDGGPHVDEDALLRRIDERTLLVCVPHASFSSGATINLPRLVAHAHDVGALVVVDAFQSVGVMPVDVTALGVDFLLGGSHKWMCGVGTAFLYVRPDLLPGLEPAATGWQAGDRALTFTPSTGWAPGAQRFAGGTPFPLTALVSQVGLDVLAGIGIDAIRAHSLACTDRILARAADAGIPVVSPVEPHRRGGVVCLDVPDGEAVKRRLAKRGMICSWRRYLRVGPHVYNTLDEIDAFMDALAEEVR